MLLSNLELRVPFIDRFTTSFPLPLDWPGIRGALFLGRRGRLGRTRMTAPYRVPAVLLGGWPARPGPDGGVRLRAANGSRVPHPPLRRGASRPISSRTSAQPTILLPGCRLLSPSRPPGLLLAAIGVLALALRFQSLGWGLPGFFEEATPYRKALEFWGVDRGDPLQSRLLQLPSLTFYLHFLAQAVAGAVGALAGGWHSLRTSGQALTGAAGALHSSRSGPGTP